MYISLNTIDLPEIWCAPNFLFKITNRASIVHPPCWTTEVYLSPSLLCPFSADTYIQYMQSLTTNGGLDMGYW